MRHHHITPNLAALMTAAVTHGALGQPQYTIVDLTELANDIGVIQCEGRSVNAAGQVVGFEGVSLGIERAIVWDSDGTAQFLEVLPKDNSTIAADIADDGTVYGLSEFVELVKCGNLIKIFETQRATMWQEPARAASGLVEWRSLSGNSKNRDSLRSTKSKSKAWSFNFA